MTCSASTGSTPDHAPVAGAGWSSGSDRSVRRTDVRRDGGRQAPLTGSRSSNPEQRAAALHRDGHLLVLAGAGTGKTTTLCARVASLVADGVPAERILLLTFTRRAARDMLTRAQALAAARLGASSAARSTRSGTASCAGTPRRSAWGRTSRCSTRAMPPTCSTSSARSRVTARPGGASRASTRSPTSTRAP